MSTWFATWRRGLVAGGLCGWGLALLLAAQRWQLSGQYLPNPSAKLGWILWSGAVGALVGAAAGGLGSVGLRAGARLSPNLAAWLRHQQRHASWRLAVIALTSAPSVVGALRGVHGLILPALSQRKHLGIVLAVTMASTLVALVVATGSVLALAGFIQRRMPPRVLTGPTLAGAATLGVACAIGYIYALSPIVWQQLQLATPTSFVIWAGLTAWAFAYLGPELRRTNAGVRPGSRRLAMLTLSVLALAPLARSQARDVAATRALTPANALVLGWLHRALDVDGDGHAAWLGGHDCAAFNARVHPSAVEIPDDGIDQNCNGADAVGTPPPPVANFSALPSTVPPKPNILLITIDTMRADHLGAYGYARPTTPVLDALGARGMVFEQAWAHAPSTRYSIPAILTGRLPLNVYYDTSLPGWPGLATKATTLAELLGPHGYHTGAIINYWYFDPQRRMNQGFAYYDNQNAARHQSVANAGPAHTTGSSSREQTDLAIRYVDAHAAEPFFLWVHYYDPHYGYETHADTPSFGTRPIDKYDHEVAFTDAQIGRLFQHLETRGLMPRTAVLVTGDHGEGFGEHGVELHGYHLYAAQTKVPLLVYVPGLPAARRRDVAGHVDIAPTLLHLAGGTIAEARAAELEGTSLLAPPATRPTTVWQQLSFENHNEQRAAISEGCHVIYYVSPLTSWEAYDIVRDPDETRDLGRAGTCGHVAGRLAAWTDLTSVPAAARAALQASPPTLATPIDVGLGPAILLRGVTYPAQARAGETLTLTWTFLAQGDIDRDWGIFLHVEGPSRYTGDHQPPRPTSWWRRGQAIQYQTELAIPANAPPGRYQLWTGAWRGATRLPPRAATLRSQDNRVAIGTLEVRP